jgi:hypothetical protein
LRWEIQDSSGVVTPLQLLRAITGIHDFVNYLAYPQSLFLRLRLHWRSFIVGMERCAWAKALVLAVFVQFFGLGFATSAKSYGLQIPKDCAKQCALTGYDPTAWSTFTGADYFTKCAWEPALFSIDDSAGVKSSSVVIKACVAQDFIEDAPVNDDFDLQFSNFTVLTVFRPACRVATPHFETETSRRSAKDSSKIIPGQVLGAATVIKDFLLRQTSSNNSDVVAQAHYGNAIIGVYIGSDFEKTDFVNGVLQEFIEGVETRGIGQTLQVQHCAENSTSSSVFGVVADTSSGVDALSSVQNAIKAWSKGACAKDLESTAPKPQEMSSTTRVASGSPGATSNWTSWSHEQPNKTGSVTSSELLQVARLTMDGEGCSKTTEVVKNDICDTLATKCGVSRQDFQNFNKPRKGDWNTFCSGLQLGQSVCCSPGGLPDLRPKRQSNGQCAVYHVLPGEWCGKVATKHGLDLEELQGFNKHTWGFDCNKIYPNAKICVSEGDPPFPAAQINATCGPTKPGTREPPGSKSSEWAKLNPCPLNACCNVWVSALSSDPKAFFTVSNMRETEEGSLISLSICAFETLC